LKGGEEGINEEADGRQRVKEGRGIEENRWQESRERTGNVDGKEGGGNKRKRERIERRNGDVLTFYREREVREEGG